MPFYGCALILKASPDSGLISDQKIPQNETTGECKGILSYNCRDAIFHRLVAYVIDNVLDAPQQEISGQSTSSMVSSVLTNPPDECNDTLWDDVIALDAFGFPSFIPDCPQAPFNIFNGSADSNFFYQDVSSAVAVDNHTDYDNALKTTVPVIFTGWPKPGKGRACAVSYSCLNPLSGVQEGSVGIANAARSQKEWVGRGIAIFAMSGLAAWYALL